MSRRHSILQVISIWLVFLVLVVGFNNCGAPFSAVMYENQASSGMAPDPSDSGEPESSEPPATPAPMHPEPTPPGSRSEIPTIAEARVSGSGELVNGAEVLILGSGFDDKENASPVFVDHVGEAYEYGALNTKSAAYADLESFLPAKQDSRSLWASVTSNVQVAKKLPKRHSQSKGAYLLNGESSWIGGPVAYGGIGGWDTPKNNDQLYASWWVKPQYNPLKYWRMSQESQSGQFIPGERLTVGTYGGVYVGRDETNFHNIVLDDHVVVNNLKGKQVKGLQSGATCRFPETFAGGKSSGYEPPGSKFVRAWDHPDGTNGMRFSWAERDAYVLIPHANGGSGVNTMEYATTDLEGGKWNHMELAIDRAKGRVALSINSRNHINIQFDPKLLKSIEYSPIVSLVGINGKQTRLMKTELTDFFMDSSIQRVILGNAETFQAITHSEVQRPTVWSDGTIRFITRLGGLESSSNVYLYVFDKDGNVNEQGYKIK